MKRYWMLAMALVLGCTMFTGCRRGNGQMETITPTTHAATETPTRVPVETTTYAPSEPMPQVTTSPNSGDVTEPSNHDATNDSSMDSTEDTGTGSRSGIHRPNAR